MGKRVLANIVVELCNDILLKDRTANMPNLNGNDWDELLQFASSQGVLPSITQGFEKNSPIVDKQMQMMMVQWYGVGLQYQQGYHQRLAVMREMTKLFADNGIDVMFLKGALLAQFYPCPEWRVFSDIDYYLFGDSEKGIAVMARHGIDNSAYYHHHTQATYKGILIENHYDFVERLHHKCDIVLDDALKEMADKEGHSLRAEFLGKDLNNAYLMTPTMNAIFLMRHMSAHFVSETISLRMLYDWALFLKKQGEVVAWERVCKLYEQSGMRAFAEIIQGLLRWKLHYECACCPVALGQLKDVEKVWDSIVNPPKSDPHAKFTLKYYLFEARTFWANRWKHKLVYPGESFILLFFKYSWLGVKKMLGMIK
jgi:hypothetical protein